MSLSSSLSGVSGFKTTFDCVDTTFDTLCFLVPCVSGTEHILNLILNYAHINLSLKNCEFSPVVSNKNVKIYQKITNRYNYYILLLKLNEKCDSDVYICMKYQLISNFIK